MFPLHFFKHLSGEISQFSYFSAMIFSLFLGQLLAFKKYAWKALAILVILFSLLFIKNAYAFMAKNNQFMMNPGFAPNWYGWGQPPIYMYPSTPPPYFYGPMPYYYSPHGRSPYAPPYCVQCGGYPNTMPYAPYPGMGQSGPFHGAS